MFVQGNPTPKYNNDQSKIENENLSPAKPVNSSDGEDMQTDNMLVFRPLFVYRRKTAQKYYVNNGNTNRRTGMIYYG